VTILHVIKDDIVICGRHSGPEWYPQIWNLEFKENFTVVYRH